MTQKIQIYLQMSFFFCTFVGVFCVCAYMRINLKQIMTLFGLLLAVCIGEAAGQTKIAPQDMFLTGTPMGSSPSVEYVNFTATTTQNLPKDAFDGDMNTFFASYERSYTWVGLDLGSRHVITRVGWSPRNDGQGPKRVQLGVFEDDKKTDLMDAVPLYVNDKKGTIGIIYYADLYC